MEYAYGVLGRRKGQRSCKRIAPRFFNAGARVHFVAVSVAVSAAAVVIVSFYCYLLWPPRFVFVVFCHLLLSKAPCYPRVPRNSGALFPTRKCHMLVVPYRFCRALRSMLWRVLKCEMLKIPRRRAHRPQEEEMYFCEETGEFIHPIFFDSHEEAREVRANSTDAEVCEASAQCVPAACGLSVTLNAGVTKRPMRHPGAADTT